MNAPKLFSRARFAQGWLVGWLAISAGCWLALSKSGIPVPSPAPASAAFDGHEAVRGVIPKQKGIEEIRVGERVWTEKHSTSAQPTRVDPKTWRLLRLRADIHWPDGTVDDVNIETLQSPEWLSEHKATVGGSVPIPLDLVEMGLPEGMRAVVMADEPCPPIAGGPGCVVLTTVNHLNADVRELTLLNEAGSQELVKPTGFHKFFLEPDEKWVSACDLLPGTQLRGKNGNLRVVDNKRVPGVHRVYNMTVETEHVYYVSKLGVLTHNPGCAQPYYGPGAVFEVTIKPPAGAPAGAGTGSTIVSAMPGSGSPIQIVPPFRPGTTNFGSFVHQVNLPAYMQYHYPNSQFSFNPRGPDAMLVPGSAYPGFSAAELKPPTPYGIGTFMNKQLPNWREQGISNIRLLLYDKKGCVYDPGFGDF